MLIVKSKYKIGKRLGNTVFEKCQTQKFALSQARVQKGRGNRGRGLSDYGKQMLEKQKVRYTYGLSEHQFRRYVNDALKVIDSPAAIHESLEMRLDNVVYRAGLAPTRRASRQMVSHGHITVNERRMNTPSHHMNPGDSFAVREGSKSSPLFTADRSESTAPLPSWITYDSKKEVGSIISIPRYNPIEVGFEYATVFEFYSR